MKRNKYINSFNTTADYNNYIESAAPGFPNVALTKDDGHVHYMKTSPNSHLFYGELVDATQNIPQIKLMFGGSTVKTYTPTVDTLTKEFYIDDWETPSTFNAMASDFLNNESNIKTIKKFKGLNTSSVTNMSRMFSGCSSLTSLDLSSLDTSSVTNMDRVFSDCTSLTSLDLSSLDTSSVTTMQRIFEWCSSLTSLDLSTCDFSSVTTMSYAFNNCVSLTDVYITVEATLMKLTNNLSSQGANYIPSPTTNTTIHYNNGSGNVDYKWQNNAWTAQS